MSNSFVTIKLPVSKVNIILEELHDRETEYQARVRDNSKSYNLKEKSQYRQRSAELHDIISEIEG